MSDMSRVAEPPGHHEKFYAPTATAARPAPVQPNPEIKVTDKLPEKVLYGPRGEVVARHDPNPPIGFSR